jgi:hypothetical protein
MIEEKDIPNLRCSHYSTNKEWRAWEKRTWLSPPLIRSKRPRTPITNSNWGPGKGKDDGIRWAPFAAGFAGEWVVMRKLEGGDVQGVPVRRLLRDPSSAPLKQPLHGPPGSGLTRGTASFSHFFSLYSLFCVWKIFQIWNFRKIEQFQKKKYWTFFRTYYF